MSTKRVRAVVQLHIRLQRIEPSIWRRVQVWEDTKLPLLHRVFQALFNWEDYHLHEFVVGRRVYSVPDADDGLYERRVTDERGVGLNRLVERVGETFVYAYDYGDDWQHDVLLEAILLPEPDGFYPRCIAGARNGPPEDAGGPNGYAAYLEALSDPSHEEHENMLAWRGEFDAEEFAVDRINAVLKRSFFRRPAVPAKSRKRGPGCTPEFAARLFGGRGAGGADQDSGRGPATGLSLELSGRERELIVKHSYAKEVLTERLLDVPASGQPAVFRYTPDELCDLALYVAMESNNTRSERRRGEWDAIYDRIMARLKSTAEGLA